MSHPSCCQEGSAYATMLVDQMVSDDDILIPEVVCYAQARSLLSRFPVKCVMAYFKSCQDEMRYQLGEYSNIRI